MKLNKILVTGLLATLFGTGLATSGSALAASNSCTGSPCTTGSVLLNFEVAIPQFVRLRIGAAGGPDTIIFDMTLTPDLIGDSSSVTGTGGDVGAGEVNVRVMANGAAMNVRVDAATGGGGSGLDCQPGPGSCLPGTDFINWDEISVTANACTVATPPALNNAGSGTANYTAATPVKENCTWTYTYDNNTVPFDGTYMGTVTYTATSFP